MTESFQHSGLGVPETTQAIPPIIAAVDVDSIEQANEFIDAISTFSNDDLGIKIPHGLALRHYNKFVPKLRKAGRFIVVDSRFNDYTNKLRDELATALQTKRKQDKHGNPPRDLPNAYTMLAIREGEEGDRSAMVNNIIPSAHRLGVRLFGILPPLPIGERDDDQLASQAYTRYMDAAEMNIDAIDIPEPALDKFLAYNTHGKNIGIIVSRLGHQFEPKHIKQENMITNNEKIEAVATTAGNVFEDRRVISIYLGRFLMKLDNNEERIACIERCLENIRR